MVELQAPNHYNVGDHLVPAPKNYIDMEAGGTVLPPKKKRRVNFNLTIDIKQEFNGHGDDACVPQGPNSLSDFSDGESLSDPIPTTPGGKPQVCISLKSEFVMPHSFVFTPLLLFTPSVLFTILITLRVI
jgi:hypothetical protein